MNTTALSGPLMIDIAGTALTPIERERLRHPLVGGMILFARNYASPQQLKQLTAEIRTLRPELLIAIDHEGGRVQRCRAGFTCLPPMRSLGEAWEQSPQEAVATARNIGYTLASELIACGVDFSFTPVLDLDYGRSSVIGDRAFHRQPEVVIALAGALIEGLRQAGMGSCGKHFPGHGWVSADSHLALPVDERSLDELQADMRPYRELPLDAVMPAHVIYPRIDPEHTACFSKKWHEYLRQNIGFDGVVFSDDLSMQGASVAGDVLARVEAAHSAGCDMLLLCNAPDSVERTLNEWQGHADAVRSARIRRLKTGD
ncbi:beta-hexosaminidase [Betaproteobacteria bacterium]|nr:beta-hexosaminidase [Betaproteobacteria bacterium]GHU42201.1 beta-hexosaminidase [Betaproteobacteria bacterium]